MHGIIMGRGEEFPTTVHPVFTQDSEGDHLASIHLTAKEAEEEEVKLTLLGKYERVSWEEKAVHDPDGSWTPQDPLYVVTDGIYEVTLGVFSDRTAADSRAAQQPKGAVTQVHTMYVTQPPSDAPPNQANPSR